MYLTFITVTTTQSELQTTDADDTAPPTLCIIQNENSTVDNTQKTGT